MTDARPDGGSPSDATDTPPGDGDDPSEGRNDRPTGNRNDPPTGNRNDRPTGNRTDPDDDPLARYRGIVDDYERFRAACERPLRMCVRANTLRVAPDRVARALDAEGIGHDRVDWHEDLFYVDTDTPGANWPYVHGWIYGQEEVSALPALALDPRPGERVFDAAAAPGSKTTQIAALVGDRGRLVANDASLGRLSALRSNCERLGVTSAVVTNRDARSYPMGPLGVDEFDRALADVPCSCEGTIRKNPDALDQWSMEHVHSVAGVQAGILRRAVQVTRPGGTVVYSTCTFAPEENEAVLDEVLGADDAACRVVDVELPVETDPGVTEWNGERFDPSVRKAARVYPHRNDTGGFFCAKLSVTG